ncbi:hypothetical protein WA026_004112 [Henosepilachna vigintioctopunctata]|uniref:Major facilitator superfamily (MFS) profile domain-containing protein n=1 Tax=Henosepilachna vigintioctopunctata TaxID=420089 RepID=A0AAW1UFJ3_9CUCU
MYHKGQKCSNLSVISECIGETDAADAYNATQDDPTTGTFEEAIAATKFGKFNLILIFVSIPAGWASVAESTTMSYVFPAAQCDLDLSLEDKGLLNASIYVGMVSSGLIWGYLCDVFGRKKLLCIGFFLDALFVIIGSLSQSFTVLLVSKFFGGVIINGPAAAFTAYISEIHSSKYRSIFQMILGLNISIGTILLPLLAQVVFPIPIDITIFNSLRIHSWNLYVFITAICPLLAGFVFLFLPESPKFLMATGKSIQAIEVFRMVYNMNTGKPEDTFPFKKLVDEMKVNDIYCGNELSHSELPKKHNFFDGCTTLGSIFIPPFLQKIILVCVLQMSIGMGLNTLRLWIPQLFQAITDYEHYNNGTSADLCTMITVIAPKSNLIVEKCVVNTDNSQVYVNSMIIAGSSALGYIVAGSLINFLGKKKLLFILISMQGLSAYSLYFATNTTMTVVFASINIAVGGISLMVVISAVVDLFPTTLRTIAVQLTMISSRLGSMGGNLIFPMLLKTGCAAPFGFIGTVLLAGAVIDLFLPNADINVL